MTIYDYFQLRLKELRNKGMTNAKIASIAGVTPQHINRMLNRPPEYLETVGLKTLVKLFPEIFDGILKRDGGASNGNSPGAAAASGNGVAISGNVTLGTGAVEVTSLDQLQSAILDDGKMCAECKVRALQMIKARK